MGRWKIDHSSTLNNSIIKTKSDTKQEKMSTSKIDKKPILL